MGLVRRHRWFIAAAGITLAYAVVSLSAHPSFALTVFSDITSWAIILFICGLVVYYAASRPAEERSFWIPIALGFSLWAANQAAWCYYEILLHTRIPDPFFFDIILFFHAVPMIAAVAWRPDIAKKSGKIFLSALNFLMLLGWWIFLYAFIVFPSQYVVKNVDVYNVYYDRLYGLENALLLAVLAFALWTSSGGWRRFYDSGWRSFLEANL